LVFLLGLLLFVCVELGSFVLVAQQIGFLEAFVILIVVSALGPFIVRRVGVGVLAHTQERLARGEVPTRELLDGLVVLLGGVMICVPGFVSDAFGLLLMIGPVRHLVIRATGRRLARRVPTIRIGHRGTPAWRPWAPGDYPTALPGPPTKALDPGGQGDSEGPKGHEENGEAW